MQSQKVVTVFVTNNAVSGFNDGWHSYKLKEEGESKVLIISNRARRAGQEQSMFGQEATSLRNPKQGNQILGDLRQRCFNDIGELDLAEVRRIYVYVGAGEWGSAALDLVREIRHQYPTTEIAAVTCGCDWVRKILILRGTGIRFYRSDCGGDDTLAR